MVEDNDLFEVTDTVDAADVVENVTDGVSGDTGEKVDGPEGSVPEVGTALSENELILRHFTFLSL